jgi:hypothetical protein
MTDYIVFFRSMSEAQRDELNAAGLGWSSPLGAAYLDCEPNREDVVPSYAGAIEFDLFEKAASISNCEDRNALWSLMQNRGANWSCEPSVRAHTDFPRSMSKGDVVYEPESGEWSYVSSGFTKLEDEAFIDFLRAKLTATELGDADRASRGMGRD